MRTRTFQQLLRGMVVVLATACAALAVSWHFDEQYLPSLIFSVCLMFPSSIGGLLVNAMWNSTAKQVARDARWQEEILSEITGDPPMEIPMARSLPNRVLSNSIKSIAMFLVPAVAAIVAVYTTMTMMRSSLVEAVLISTIPVTIGHFLPFSYGYPFKVNWALAGLQVPPTVYRGDFRSNMQILGKIAKLSPEETALVQIALTFDYPPDNFFSLLYHGLVDREISAHKMEVIDSLDAFDLYLELANTEFRFDPYSIHDENSIYSGTPIARLFRKKRVSESPLYQCFK